MDKPAVWQMIKEAVSALGGKASYPEIKAYIHNKWGDVNDGTINAQLLVLSVNQPSRTQFSTNKKPRIADGPYDLLFSVGSGKIVTYDPREHGIWEIYQTGFGGLSVRQVISEPDEKDDIPELEDGPLLFPIEANLRDFLILNLNKVKGYKLKLYVDGNGRDGKEYPTEVGPIDILTVDQNGDFVVFELKLSRGPDKALGQLLRYMGWIKQNLATDKQVKGIIVANKMDHKIKYAVTMTVGISLYEYELKFELNQPA